jgi:hypothetical protein
VTEDAEGPRGIAKAASDLLGGAALEEKGAQGFIHAMPGMGGLGKEVVALRYAFWYAYIHTRTVVQSVLSARPKCGSGHRMVTNTATHRHKA